MRSRFRNLKFLTRTFLEEFYLQYCYSFNPNQVHEIKHDEDFNISKSSKIRVGKSTRLKQIEEMEKIMRQTIHEKLLDDKGLKRSNWGGQRMGLDPPKMMT